MEATSVTWNGEKLFGEETREVSFEPNSQFVMMKQVDYDLFKT